MTNSVKVSILVPIYNVAMYLDDCLSSLTSQTLKEIEIICINDGSTDSSLEIIKKYAVKDKRIAFIDKKNSGYGDSMNHGLRKAGGEFIGIVESDDFIKPEMFSKLYELAIKNNAQVVKSNAFWYWTDTNKAVLTELVDSTCPGKVITPRENIHHGSIFYKIPAIWSGIYRRDFLEKNKIDFLPTSGASYQDTGFFYKIWAMADRVIYTDKAYLYYRQDNAASSMNNIDKKAPALFKEFSAIKKYLVANDRANLIPLVTEREFVSLYNFLMYIRGSEFLLFAQKILKQVKDVKINRDLFESEMTYYRFLLVTKSPELYLLLKKTRTAIRLAKTNALKPLSSFRRYREIKWLRKDLAERRQWPGPDRSLAGGNLREKVSVIVPVYNGEQRLCRCLRALISQTYKNIEIICVNDGSTDDSAKILDRFAKKDKRIKIVEQCHKGVATARNVGLDRAKAPYVMWCDSDDTYEKNMVEEMLRTITLSGSDMAECGTNIKCQDGIQNIREQGIDDYLRLKFIGKQVISEWVIQETDASLWNKIYRRKIIKDNSIRFPDGLHFEDAYFNDVFMMSAKSAYYLNKKLYNYMRHEDSIMARSFSQNRIAADYSQIAIELYESLVDRSLYESFIELYWRRFCKYNNFTFNNVSGADRRIARRKMKAFLVSNKKSIEKLPRTTRHGITTATMFSYALPQALKRAVKFIVKSPSKIRFIRNKQIAEIKELKDEITDTF